MMESTPSNKRRKQSKNLTLEKTLAALTVTFKKECKIINISKIMNMVRPGMSPAVHSFLQRSQRSTASVERSFTML